MQSNGKDAEGVVPHGLTIHFSYEICPLTANGLLNAKPVQESKYSGSLTFTSLGDSQKAINKIIQTMKETVLEINGGKKENEPAS